MDIKKYQPILYLLLTIQTIAVFCAKTVYADIDKFAIESARAADDMLLSGRFNVTFIQTEIDSTSNIAVEQIKFLSESAKTKGRTVLIRSKDLYVYSSYAFEDIKLMYQRKWVNDYLNGPTTAVNETKAFNGEKMDVYRIFSYDNNNQSSIKASILPVCQRSDEYNPMHYGYYVFGSSVSDFLQGTFKNRKLDGFKVLGEELINDEKCTVVQGTISETDSTITAWFAEDMLYRPARVDIETATTKWSISIKQKQYNESIWFPESVHFDSFYSEKKTDPKILAYVWTMTVDSVELNIDLPCDIFEYKFTKGTKVNDFRTNQILVAGYDFDTDE